MTTTDTGTMDTASEAWRAECEARWVMRLPKERRQAFYALVADRRGKAAAERLIADVRRLWSEKGQAALFGCGS